MYSSFCFHLCYLFFCVTLPCNSGILQLDDSILVYGTCYDISTGIDLKVRAYGLSENNRLLLGESDNLGKFNLNVPCNIKYIQFESDNFKSITIQATIFYTKKNNLNFRISVPMSAKDSLEPDPTNQLSLYFSSPNTIDINYKLHFINNKSKGVFFSFKKGKHPDNFLLVDIVPGDYVFTAYSSNGDLLFDEEININQGVTFKEIIFTKNKYTYDENKLEINKKKSKKLSPSSDQDEDILINASYVDKLINPTILNFAQSSYELTSQSKITLDSIYDYLSNNTKIVINIIGYTDNIGNRNLNLALSEYRARVAKGYLVKKGIDSSRITFTGKGPDPLVVSNNTEENQIKSRKAVVIFSNK